MSRKTYKYFAVKSKKTGLYFKFVQYAEDGWGKYEDNCDLDNHSEDVPDLFLYPINKTDIDHWDQFLNDFKDHNKEDLEFIPVEVTIGA